MEKKFKLFKIPTVNRQSTDGQSLRQYSVSTRLFRLAALFTLLFTIGVGQMWGYWYVPSKIYSEIEWNTNCTQMSSDNYLTYYCVPAGTYEFKLAVDKNSSITWGNGTLTNGTPSIITELTSANTSYSDGGSGYNNTITVNSTCNIIFHMTDGSADGTWACTVTAGAPTLPIRANFNNNNSNWVWKTMQSNGDGTVSVKGLYGSCSGYDIRRTSREVEASWAGQYISTNISTTGTTPEASDNCVFTYDPSEGLAANASLTIRKANTITKNNYIYFDNKDAEWSDAHIYFVIGHAEYSKMYELTAITNTKLMRHINEADSWTDGSYYALAGGSSEWDKGTSWGYPSLLAWNHHTAAYTSAYNLRSGYYYIVGKENGDNGGAITLTEPGNAYTSLNSLTVGFKYAWDDDGDGTFTDMSSGTTPAQISMTSYAFSNCSTVVANTAQTITANSSGTYSKSLANTAYRGKVTLTVSGVRDGWKFIGWYEGNTEKSTGTSYTYYPNANTTITARFENRWSIKGTLKGQNWDVDNYITHFVQDGSGDEIGYWEETLTGNTNYVFKVVDRKDEGWWTYSTVDATESDLTYAADNNAEHSFNSTGSHGNTKIYTAANGTYRFTWNATDHTLTVTYPNSYQVTYDGNGNSSGTLPTDNTYYASGETVTVAANGGSLEKTNYASLAYWTTVDGSADYAVGSGTFSITANTTLYARWTQTITLDSYGADAGQGGAANVTVSYNYNTNMTSAITKPQKTGYVFSGYYDLAYGSGSQIIDADGNFTENVTNYISDGKWTRTASAPTLYAYWKHECSASAYTIRCSTSGVSYESTCFTQVGSTNEWNVEDFVIPSLTKYSVGYNEDVYASDLGSANSSSVEKLWTDTYAEVSSVGNGAMQLLPAGASARAVGQATGAIGKLVIWDNTAHKNLSVGFLPNGYGVTTAEGTYAFTIGDGYFCYTDPITISSTEASGDFQVKLATSDSYVACAQGASEKASAVNGRKISGDADIANGKKGVFQMWQNATANNFGLRFVTVYDVSFDLQGHGSAISDYQNVRYNDKIVAPSDPEATGYTFRGWYKEPGCTNAWDFETDVVTATTTLYAKWTANNYTVRFENLGADTGHKGSLDTTVTYNASTNMGPIEKPAKTHYDFGGYWTSTNRGSTLTTQLIDANGNWIKDVSGYTSLSGDNPTWVCAGDTTLYAKWTEHAYTITLSVSPSGSGTISPSSSTTGKYVTASGDITATANAGWVFKEWQFSKTDKTYDAYSADGYSSLVNPVRINAVHDGTLTAVFEPRYYLVGGEIMGGNDAIGTGISSGMPGWDNYTDTFKIISNSPSLLATCSLTLGTNKNFYIMVRDRADGLSYGTSSSISWDSQSAVFDTRDVRATFQSNGGTAYTFKITAVNGSGRPTVSVERPYQVNVGRKRVDIDGKDHDDNTGGTVAMSLTVGGDAVSNGAWVPYGTSVKYDASTEDGYSLAWFTASDYAMQFSTDPYWFHIATSTGNGYAKFTEKATTVTLANDGHGKVQISSTDKTSTTCGVTTTRSLTAVPNTGYSFSSWTKTSGDDITISSTSTNPTTLTGQGAGATSGQTVTANFSAKTYSVTLHDDHGGSNNGSATATYDQTTIDVSSHASFSGWNLLGYWNTDGNQVTDASGNVQANVSDYTDASSHWHYDNGVTLYAHWSRSVSLDREDGTTGSTSMTVIYKSSTLGSYSAPTKTGYNFAGYYTGDNGTGTMVINTSGVLQSNVTGYTNSDGQWTKEDATTLYAKWTPATLTFIGETDSDWDDASNWSPAYLPTIEHDVVLNVPVEVNIDHATAKSIVLDQNSHTGSLTIQANKGLEVTGTIQVYNGSSYSATTPADLVLESSASGNATLIFDNSNSDQATVQMYSKGWTTGEQGGGTWNWQFVGVPVTDATRMNDYYGGYMYEWSSGWVDKTDMYGALTPFTAYSVTYPTTSDNLHTYSIDGTLAATTNQTIDVAAGQTVQAAANSWTAPIRITDITSTNWSPATIFLYNTGYNPEGSAAGKGEVAGDRYAAGKYLPIPVSSAPYLGESYIAPMQGFLFKNTKSGSDGTITLNYSSAVRTDGSEGIVAGAMHAPQRQMEAEPTVMKIYVSDSLYDDRVVLLARNDFSRGFDNGWDGEKFQVNAVKTAPRLFAINETGGKEEVSAIPELENTVIGFRPGKEETYTIHFDYNGDETLYLRDTRTGAETLITNESKYIFLSDGTNEDARFIISRIQSTPTGVEDINAGSKAYKLMIEDHIYIIRDGRMYSVDGALVK